MKKSSICSVPAYKNLRRTAKIQEHAHGKKNTMYWYNSKT